MHALLVDYALRGVTAAEHAELSEQLAPALAAIPGLVSLVWLTNDATGRYGAFYLFEHKPAFDAFVASELYEALRRQPSVRALTTAEFSIERISGPRAYELASAALEGRTDGHGLL